MMLRSFRSCHAAQLAARGARVARRPRSSAAAPLVSSDLPPLPTPASTEAAAVRARRRQLPLELDNTRLAFAHRSSLELVRALAVLRVCGWPWLVRHAETLLQLSFRVLGERATLAIVRHTFFAHFCAGEAAEDTVRTVQRLAANNVKAIMDYAAEADVEQARADQLHDEAMHRTDELHSARTFQYEGEAECDANATLILESIENAGLAGGRQFVAMKLTAIAKPELLEKASTVLRTIKNLWIDEFGDPVEARAIDRERFDSFIEAIGVKMSDEEQSELFAKLDRDFDGKIDYIEWSRLLSTQSLLTRRFFLKSGYQQMGLLTAAPVSERFSHLLPLLNETETELLDRFMDRLDRIAERAAERNVRIMVDAEQTYMQPAIDHFTRRLQQQHNRESPIIFNTYQAYLKSAPVHLRMDLERCRRRGICFAGKLVRGAYMVGERARAHDLGLPSPICDTVEETHRQYDDCVEQVLRTRESPQKAELVVATHNRKSIEHTVALMDELDVDRQHGGVYFGQLLGMSDNLTFPLGLSGYNAFKYVPYGPVKEVIPYLLRRAQENSDMLSNAPFERNLLRTELWRRLRA